MLLDGGNLTEKTLQKLTNTADFKEFLEELQHCPEYSMIRDKISTIEQTGSLSHVIRSLEKQHLIQATKSSYLHPLSILPILDYLIRKKIETENLRILARGKEKKLSEPLMKEMLVI
jgi:V/A-type H+/Na+-transporting ATPase subunit C